MNILDSMYFAVKMQAIKVLLKANPAEGVVEDILGNADSSFDEFGNKIQAVGGSAYNNIIKLVIISVMLGAAVGFGTFAWGSEKDGGKGKDKIVKSVIAGAGAAAIPSIFILITNIFSKI